MERIFARLELEEEETLEKQFLETLERQLNGVEMNLLDKAMIFHLQTRDEIVFEYEVGNFIKPLRFFVSNRHTLKFLQEGVIHNKIQELNIHKPFWVFSTTPSKYGFRELYYRNK